MLIRMFFIFINASLKGLLPSWYPRSSVISNEGCFRVCTQCMLCFLCRNDEEWHRHRSALNPKLLNIKQVEHYSPDFNVVIDKLMIKLMSMRNKDLEIEHIEKQLFRWSLESMF